MDHNAFTGEVSATVPCRLPDAGLDEEPVCSAPEIWPGVRYCFQSGSMYSGEWQETRRHGVGCQRWPDGAEYCGEWRDNCANGRGEFRHRNGDVYIGEWVCNAAHGHGRYKRGRANPLSEIEDGYVGQFQHDVQHGYGIERWPDGTSYEGQYFHGQKSGHGVYTWPDGSRYEGSWHSNRISGAGAYTGCDGRVYRGQWRQFWHQGVQHGAGRLHTAKGSIGTGVWEAGQRIRWSIEELPPETSIVVFLRAAEHPTSGRGVALICTDFNGDCIAELETTPRQTVGQVRAALLEKLVNTTLANEECCADLEDRQSSTSKNTKNASTATGRGSLGGRLLRTELVLEGGSRLPEKEDHAKIVDVLLRVNKEPCTRNSIRQTARMLRSCSSCMFVQLRSWTRRGAKGGRQGALGAQTAA